MTPSNPTIKGEHSTQVFIPHPYLTGYMLCIEVPIDNDDLINTWTLSDEDFRHAISTYLITQLIDTIDTMSEVSPFFSVCDTTNQVRCNHCGSLEKDRKQFHHFSTCPLRVIPQIKTNAKALKERVDL